MDDRKDIAGMKKTAITLHGTLFFVLITLAGLLLSAPIGLAMIVALGWTALTTTGYSFFLREKSSEISLSSSAEIFSPGFAARSVLFSFLIAVAIVVFLLGAFEFISSSSIQGGSHLAALRQIPIALQSLIAFWSVGMLCIFSRFFSQRLMSSCTSVPMDESSDCSASQAGPLHKVFPDLSLLDDGRAYDLARLGLFDGKYVIPSFYINELKELAQEGMEETLRIRARKALDSIKRLEMLPRSSFQIVKADATTADDLSKSLNDQLLDYAKQQQSKILTLDSSVYKSEGETPFYVLSLEAICAATKPSFPKGEYIFIKIQRLGKEPKQGIGYLDDSTMVVVNGGGDFLGKTIRAQFLSQKYSTSGKIVFCNAAATGEEDMHASPASTHNPAQQPCPQGYTQVYPKPASTSYFSPQNSTTVQFH